MKQAEADNLRKENGDIKEEVKKKEAENARIELEYEAKLRESNIAYNTKEGEAADLKKEKRDLMQEIGRKDDEIEALKVSGMKRGMRGGGEREKQRESIKGRERERMSRTRYRR